MSIEITKKICVLNNGYIPVKYIVFIDNNVINTRRYGVIKFAWEVHVFWEWENVTTDSPNDCCDVLLGKLNQHWHRKSKCLATYTAQTNKHSVTIHPFHSRQSSCTICPRGNAHILYLVVFWMCIDCGRLLVFSGVTSLPLRQFNCEASLINTGKTITGTQTNVHTTIKIKFKTTCASFMGCTCNISLFLALFPPRMCDMKCYREQE